MTVKKRHYHNSRGSSGHRIVRIDTSSHTPRIVIEPEDDLTRKHKRSRGKETRLNLLIRAIFDQQIQPEGNDSKYTVNRTSKLVSRKNSSTASNSTPNEIVSALAKKIVDRVPPDERSPAMISNDDLTSSMASSSLLPRGRPLMAPPRLPEKFIPRKWCLSTNTTIRMETTLSCQVHYTNKGKLNN